MKSLLLSLAVLLAVPHILSAEIRDFTDTQGRTMRAEITGTDGRGKIDLRREDGAEFKGVAITMFSAADQVYIRNWIEVYLDEMKAKGQVPISEANMRVSFNPNRTEEIEVSKRFLIFKPEVKVFMKGEGEGFQGVRCQLCIIGKRRFEDVDYFTVMRHEKFVLNIKPNAQVEWKGEPFMNELTENGDGFEYAGYVMLLKDQSGMDLVKSSSTVWTKYFANVLKAQPDLTYNQTFAERIVGYF